MTDSLVKITESQSNSQENDAGNSLDPLPPVIPNVENSLPSPVSISNDLSTDLYLPIALRKGKRSCTSHPLSKHVSYSKLSQSHRSYVFKVTTLFIPNTIQEALNDPD